jgi:hypothetical protein
MDEIRLVESIKYLLSSVKKLTDSFVALEKRVTLSFKNLAANIDNLLDRIELLEKKLIDLRDGNPPTGLPPSSTELPVNPETKEQLVPRLNLPLDGILDVYATTPTLLEPFSRPCSVTGLTLSGEIDEVELEVFNQGTTWALESLEGAWLLVPRPGSLERRTQLETLERLYTIEGVKELPVLLQLIEPAKAVAVQHGRRWQLSQKGRLSVNPDPLRVSMDERLLLLEDRLAKLEAING